MGTDLTVARNPSILLASELTDCLAKRYLNRARCLALVVSGEKVTLSCIATDVAPRAGFKSGLVSLVAYNDSSAFRTGRNGLALHDQRFSLSHNGPTIPR